ncbi:hypothetical protein B0E53_00785 [Micromonospora sp. MH33]|uniref:hypothetical protein n=1 Tax=Micromonospora sp. MH33 TaxID=1945509 RepID=UPI000D2A717C|nr:hypothetical protein [Micromonospora sp. MH33]PSK67253.1 hypothetical protein B0E53_00785 [Micromonospora sp. MH33]
MFSRERSRRGLTVVGLTLLGYGVMILSGALGLVVPYAVAAAVVIAGELTLATRYAETGGLLRKAGLGLVFRRLLRDLSVVLLVVSAVRPGPAGTVAVLLLPAALWTVAAGTTALARAVDGRAATPALTRNLDLGGLRRAPVPPAWARRLAGLRLPLLNVLLVPAAVVAAAADRVTPVVVTGVVTLAAGLLTVAVPMLTRSPGRGEAPGVLPAVYDWLARERPEVALYFAGPAKDVYQANMWLAPVEAAGRRAVVLLRAEDAFRELADTRLPVICVPAALRPGPAGCRRPVRRPPPSRRPSPSAGPGCRPPAGTA